MSHETRLRKKGGDWKNWGGKIGIWRLGWFKVSIGLIEYDFKEELAGKRVGIGKIGAERLEFGGRNDLKSMEVWFMNNLKIYWMIFIRWLILLVFWEL